MGAPPEEHFGDVLRWAWAALRQLERFLDYYAPGRHVYSPTIPEDAPADAWSWEVWHAAQQTDLHFLLIACNQFVKAVDRLRPEAEVPGVPEDLRQDISTMRNVWEHWDEHRDAFRIGEGFERSGVTLRSRHPEIHPETLEMGAEIKLGPLPLGRIWNEVTRIEQAVLELRAPRISPAAARRRRSARQSHSDA